MDAEEEEQREKEEELMLVKRVRMEKEEEERLGGWGERVEEEEKRKKEEELMLAKGVEREGKEERLKWRKMGANVDKNWGDAGMKDHEEGNDEELKVYHAKVKLGAKEGWEMLHIDVKAVEGEEWLKEENDCWRYRGSFRRFGGVEGETVKEWKKERKIKMKEAATWCRRDIYRERTGETSSEGEHEDG